MYSIYTTEGLIVDSVAMGEANRLYSVFTKDFGLIRGIAQGVRKSVSKLAPHMQFFNLVNLSLVRGKEMWRLTSATSLSPASQEIFGDIGKRTLYGRVFELLKRLIAGESKNEALYDILKNFRFFLESKKFTKEELLSLELIILLRIMNNLGYVDQPNMNKYLQSAFDNELLASMLIDKTEALAVVNKSIRESHM